MHPKFQNKVISDAIKKAADNNRAILEQMLSIMEDEELPEMESIVRWIVYNVSQLDDLQLAHLMLTVSTPKEKVSDTETDTDNEDLETDEDENVNTSFTLKLLHLNSFSDYEETSYHCYFKLSGELIDDNVYSLHNCDNSELATELVDSIDELYPYFANLIHLTVPPIEHLLERSTSPDIDGNPLEGPVRQFSFETDQAKYEVEIDLEFIYSLQTMVDKGEPDEHAKAD